MSPFGLFLVLGGALFGIIETMYFGFNTYPLSQAEHWCDLGAMFLIWLGVFIDYRLVRKGSCGEAPYCGCNCHDLCKVPEAHCEEHKTHRECWKAVCDEYEQESEKAFAIAFKEGIRSHEAISLLQTIMEEQHITPEKHRDCQENCAWRIALRLINDEKRAPVDVREN